METERLSGSGVREIAQMQKIIDTLESAIASLDEIAKGNVDAINIAFTYWEGDELIQRMYGEIRDKLIELQDGKAE